MTNISPIHRHGVVTPFPSASTSSARHTEYTPAIDDQEAERLCCTLASRPPAAALPRAHPASLTARLLDPARGFVTALSRIYAADLSRGFERLCCIDTVDCSAAFAADVSYRRRVLEEVGRQALEDGGFLAIRPAQGMWTTCGPWVGARNEELGLCRLFGSCGFAQLCDPELEKPVPLLVRPWSRRRGLLEARRPPTEPFSSSLRVQRLDHGRMILLESATPAAASLDA